MTSTPASRARRRDFWTHPATVRVCKFADWITALAATFAILFFGSIAA